MSRNYFKGRDGMITANWLIGLIFSLFLIVNLITAERWPTVSMDEVMYADPGVNLALDGHFTSSAWYHQGSDKLWAGQPPGYSLLIAGWVSLFGFDITSVRTLNYVLILLVASGLLLLFRRLRVPGNGLIDVAFLLVFLCGAGVSVNFRSVRPEILAMLNVLSIGLAAMLASRRVRLISIAVAAAFTPLTGLQTLAYLAVVCVVWLALMRSKVAEIVAIGTGAISGLLALLAFYAETDTLGVFVEYMREHAMDGAVPLTHVYFSDRSLLPAVAAGALLDFTTRGQIPVERFRLGRVLVAVGAVTPLSLAILGKYPITYAWMAYLPVVFGAMLFMTEISLRNLGRLGQVAVATVVGFLAFASATGFPARMVVTALEWRARSYRVVEEFITGQVNRSDVAFGDFAAYYPLRKMARNAFFGDYVLVMSPEQKASLTILIVGPNDAEATVALVGGHWIQEASFKTVPDSFPRHLGFARVPGYDFVVMRRFEASAAGL